MGDGLSQVQRLIDSEARHWTAGIHPFVKAGLISAAGLQEGAKGE